MVGINYSSEQILEGIKKAEANRSYYLMTNFVDRDKLPQWSDFMNAIYYMASQDVDEVLAGQINKSRESLVGNLIIQSGIYFNFKAKDSDNARMFPQVLEMLKEMPPSIPIVFYGPKVSMGPYFVVPHQDRWHAATLQCEGETIWSLKDEKYIYDKDAKFKKNDPNVSRIVLKPGDFLYFSQKLFHQIEVEGPRASILFNSSGVLDKLSQ